MAMQFDEQPVGTSEHTDLRLLPEGEPVHGRGISSRDGAVVENGPRRTQGAPEVGYERTLHHERKSLGHASRSQVVSLTVRCCLIERQSTFINGINLLGLCGMP